MTQTPAGWFPDPAPQAPGQPPLLRYWDGQQWTEHLHPAWPATEPGAAPFAGPTTPDGVPLSGWWRRVGAYVIDEIIVGIVSGVLIVPVQFHEEPRMQRVLDRYQRAVDAGATPDLGRFFHDYLDAARPIFLWSILAGFVIFAVYNAGFLRWKGATPGMMALGIGVRLRDQPGQLPWSTLAVRVLAQQGYALFGLISIWLSFGLFWYPWLDGLWPLWSRKNQALHDIAAKTNVVHTR